MADEQGKHKWDKKEKVLDRWFKGKDAVLWIQGSKFSGSAYYAEFWKQELAKNYPDTHPILVDLIQFQNNDEFNSHVVPQLKEDKKNIIIILNSDKYFSATGKGKSGATPLEPTEWPILADYNSELLNLMHANPNTRFILFHEKRSLNPAINMKPCTGYSLKLPQLTEDEIEYQLKNMFDISTGEEHALVRLAAKHLWGSQLWVELFIPRFKRLLEDIRKDNTRILSKFYRSFVQFCEELLPVCEYLVFNLNQKQLAVLSFCANLYHPVKPKTISKLLGWSCTQQDQDLKKLGFMYNDIHKPTYIQPIIAYYMRIAFNGNDVPHIHNLPVVVEDAFNILSNRDEYKAYKFDNLLTSLNSTDDTATRESWDDFISDIYSNNSFKRLNTAPDEVNAYTGVLEAYIDRWYRSFPNLLKSVFLAEYINAIIQSCSFTTYQDPYEKLFRLSLAFIELFSNDNDPINAGIINKPAIKVNIKANMQLVAEYATDNHADYAIDLLYESINSLKKAEKWYDPDAFKFLRKNCDHLIQLCEYSVDKYESKLAQCKNKINDVEV